MSPRCDTPCIHHLGQSRGYIHQVKLHPRHQRQTHVDFMSFQPGICTPEFSHTHGEQLHELTPRATTFAASQRADVQQSGTDPHRQTFQHRDRLASANNALSINGPYHARFPFRSRFRLSHTPNFGLRPPHISASRTYVPATTPVNSTTAVYKLKIKKERAC